MTNNQPLPKEVLLRKLLRMTTSDNDAEALTAIRKANSLMKDNSWDWDKLLDAKIKIAANPFVGLTDPRAEAPAKPAPTGNVPGGQRSPTPGGGSPPWAAKPNTGTTPPPPSPPPKPVIYQPTASNPLSKIPNGYPGHCYCCGDEVVAGGGLIFKARDYVQTYNAPGNFQVVCKPCNTSGIVRHSSAPVARKKNTINSLA